MNNMIEIKLGKLCEITSSKRIFASEYVEDGILFCRSKEIIEMANNKKITEPLYISKERFDEIKNKFGVPQNGDLLLTSVGTLGVPYVVKENDCFYFKDGNLTWMKNFSNKLNSKYLYYWLFSDFGKAPLLACAIGSSQGAITIDILNRFKIACPDRKIQDVIVSVLSRYDELIEINNKRIKLLEQAAEIYFRKSYESEIKNKNTSTIRLKEILSFTRGLSYSSEEIDCDEGITLVNLKNIQAYGGFRRDGNKLYNGEYKERQLVQQGDLIMGVTDMTQDRRTVGSVALIPDIAGVCVISADLIKIETDINKSFLYCLFRFGNVSKYISQFANGANVLHLKPEVIKKVKVMMPTQEYIKAFSRIVTPMLDEIEMLYQQNDNLIKQRDLLLPRLMSGKLSVETKTGSVPKVKKIISFDKFCSNMGMAARAKSISDEDLRAMYEAYIDDDATE